MRKIENRPLQTSSIFSRPWQIFCIVQYSDRKPRACQKLGVGKCPGAGQRKIFKCPTPGSDKAGKYPAVARGGGGAGHSWNWLLHYQSS